MKSFHKKILGLIFVGLAPWVFSENSVAIGASDPLELQMVQILTQIQSQLQTLTNQQAQLQQSFQNYQQFQLQATYPSIPFPGWKSVQISSLQVDNSQASGINSLNLLLNPVAMSSYQESIKKQVLRNTLASLSQPSNDSDVSNEINNYTRLVGVNKTGLTQVQAQELTNQLLVLNAKATYLQYQEERRLENVFVSQLFIQAQQKPTEGVSKP